MIELSIGAGRRRIGGIKIGDRFEPFVDRQRRVRERLQLALDCRALLGSRDPSSAGCKNRTAGALVRKCSLHGKIDSSGDLFAEYCAR